MSIPHQNKIAAGPMVLDIHLHDWAESLTR
jgi:hypothetical protein